MTIIYKATNSSTLKRNLAEVLDNISSGKEAQIIQRVKGKEDAILLSYQVHLDLVEEINKLTKELNQMQLNIAAQQFEEGDFETFIINKDGSREYL